MGSSSWLVGLYTWLGKPRGGDRRAGARREHAKQERRSPRFQFNRESVPNQAFVPKLGHVLMENDAMPRDRMSPERRAHGSVAPVSAMLSYLVTGTHWDVPEHDRKIGRPTGARPCAAQSHVACPVSEFADSAGQPMKGTGGDRSRFLATVVRFLREVRVAFAIHSSSYPVLTCCLRCSNGYCALLMGRGGLQGHH
jgi:hypothetical protein